MAGNQFLFIAANIAALAILTVYLYKQFENKLEFEWKEFEKKQRSWNYENT